MIAPDGPLRWIRTPRGQLGVAVALATLAIGLIAWAELTPARSSTRSGIYGYLILQLAGILGLNSREERWAGTLAVVLRVLLLANLILLAALSGGLLGPKFVLVAVDLVFLFVSGAVGLAAVLASLVSTRGGRVGRPRPPLAPALAAVILGTFLAGTAVGEEVRRPPPQPTGVLEPPRGVATPTRRQSVTPTPSPTTPPDRTFPLAIRIVGRGSVVIRTERLTCDGACTFSIRAGSTVTLTAAPAADSIFARWDGCETPCQVRMDGERRVEATFRLPLLRVTVDGKAPGTVRSAPDGIACPPTCEAPFARGTLITLRGAPEGSSAFVGWSDGCAGLGTCELEMRGDAAASARFERPAVGYGASVCEDSGFATVRQGATATFRACFLNTGTTTWQRGTATEVVLGQCCPLGASSPFIEWGVGWPSKTTYAVLVPSAVVPGQIGTASFQIRVPTSAALGEHRIDGYLVRVSTGEPVAGGAFSVVVTVVR